MFKPILQTVNMILSGGWTRGRNKPLHQMPLPGKIISLHEYIIPCWVEVKIGACCPDTPTNSQK